MAEVIQFPCPACGATLMLPAEMAAIQGPCPQCQQEIIAPDPASGRGAHLPESPEPSPEDPIEEPVSETSSQPDPRPVTGEASSPRRTARRGILLLAFLLTAIMSLAAGYHLGVRSVCPMTTGRSDPQIKAPPTPPEPVPEPSAPTPKSEPEPEELRQPAEKPAPVKASAAAEATLKAFLEAPDWAVRSAYVLTPETVRPAMEAYSRKVPDGPTPFRSISIQNSYTDKDSGNTLFIFQVITEAHPTGIPVAVSETASGWLVDWQTFVEFRDKLFTAFAEGPADATGRFHLIVSPPPPPRGANTENEHFSSFLLDPPLPDHQRLAYVRKPTQLHDTLKSATANGAIFTPVLEVTKRKASGGKTYLEITGITANHWLPEGW